MFKWFAPNADMEEMFWQFIKARQDVWYNRHIEKKPMEKWTNDPVLQQSKFTNVYRFLDRNTQYVLEEILECTEHDEYWQLLAHIITFRWFNRIGTYKVLRGLITPAAEGDDDVRDGIAELLDIMSADKKLRIFTSAYIAGVRKVPLGTSNGKHYLSVLTELYALLPELEALVMAPSCAIPDVCKLLQRVDGIGHFIAYQMALDTMYPIARLGGRRLANAMNVNSWTDIGPGCANGLVILGVKGTDAILQRACKGLHAKSVGVLHPMGFRWVRGSDSVAVPLSLGDIENCLCEFSKYVRIRSGGHSKTNYRPLSDMEWRPSYITTPWLGEWHEDWSGIIVHGRKRNA